jgi:hypothetical protein
VTTDKPSVLEDCVRDKVPVAARVGRAVEEEPRRGKRASSRCQSIACTWRSRGGQAH